MLLSGKSSELMPIIMEILHDCFDHEIGDVGDTVEALIPVAILEGGVELDRDIRYVTTPEILS